MDIQIKPGQAKLITVTGNIDENIEFHDNYQKLRYKPSIEIHNHKDLRKFLEKKPKSVTFLIDNSQGDSIYFLYSVSCNNVLLPIRNVETFVHKPKLSQNVISLDTIAEATKSHQLMMPQLAVENAGILVWYYKANVIERLPNLNADIIKSITERREIPVLVPNRSVFNNLDFDKFGLIYDQLMILNIVKTVWEEYQMSGKPQNNDIIYFPVTNQLLEVSNVTAIKDVKQDIISYELTMTIVTDRASVEKSNDLLDLSKLMEPLKEDKTEALASRTLGIYRNTEFEDVDVIELDEHRGNWIYAIIWWLGQWCKFEYRNADDGVFCKIATLKDEPLADLGDFNGTTIEATKFATFNSQLNPVQSEMLFSSVQLPPMLKPVHWFSHVRKFNRNF